MRARDQLVRLSCGRLGTRKMATAACQGVGTKPKVLILTGPTGVGKTKASLALAERLNGEVISADSVQVYRGLDVGSDKASLECGTVGACGRALGATAAEQHLRLQRLCCR